jgi:hypothetical protein
MTRRSELHKKLSAELSLAPWKELRGHVARDGVLVIDQSLDLVEVGTAFALDDKVAVEQWLTQQLITKPDSNFLNQMEKELEMKFQFLIIQPFVLIQSVKLF